ncbi:E3 ubiquitin-protein ligase TRIM56-like [Glandiceps talaboti]
MAAQAFELLDKIDENFLECSICLERYRSAKCLPCLHNFCQPCLVKLVEKTRNSVTCPTCRRSHDLPNDGVEGIADNFFINKLVDMFSKQKISSSESRKCEGCQQGECVQHCVECGLDLCSECVKAHTRFPMTKSHQIMTLDKYSCQKSDDPVKVRSPVYCRNHKDYQVEFFCDDCESTICLKCTALDHRNHSYHCVKEAAKSYTETLAKMIGELKVKGAKAAKTQQEIKKIDHDLDVSFQTESDKLEKHIHKTREDVLRLIQESGNELTKELKDEYDTRKANLNVQLNKINCTENDVSSVSNYAENFLKYGNAAQLMSAKKAMSIQMEALLREEPRVGLTENGNMRFEPYYDFCTNKTVGVVCKVKGNYTEDQGCDEMKEIDIDVNIDEQVGIGLTNPGVTATLPHRFRKPGRGNRQPSAREY